MEMKRLLGPVLALLVLAGVGGGIWVSSRSKQTQDAAAKSRVTVSILTGSEKEAFLTDPRLTALLDAEGITLKVQKAGSREIATRPDLKTFDAAFPAGSHAATKIAKATGAKQVFSTYYTPMTVASWKQLVPVLESGGIVKQKSGAYFIIDMPKLLSLMDQGTRWKDLPGNTAYPVSKAILVRTTDVRTSNSAAMYLALVSYLANEGNVIQSEADVDKVLPKVLPLFAKQGFQDSSSSGPFEDYTAAGVGLGKMPLLMIYESQFIEYVAKRDSVNPDMVLLYPEPTVVSRHTLIALNDKGARLGQALALPAVQKLAQEYGLRTGDSAELIRLAQAKKLAVPTQLIDVIDPPQYELLESLIVKIDQAMSK